MNHGEWLIYCIFFLSYYYYYHCVLYIDIILIEVYCLGNVYFKTKTCKLLNLKKNNNKLFWKKNSILLNNSENITDPFFSFIFFFVCYLLLY